MARFPDPHSRLGNALANAYQAQMIRSRQTPWASATFSGARHHYVLRMPCDAQPDSTGLDDHEFDLPGHILADLSINNLNKDGGAFLFTIEALTVEDV